MVAAHAHPERRLHHALDLLVEELAGALVEPARLAQALALSEASHRDPGVDVADHDQPPRLHQPDRRRAVRRRQHAFEHVVVNRVRTEAPHIAALGDHAVHDLPLGLVVAPAARVGRALGGARGIEARRRGWTRKALARNREWLRRAREALVVAHRWQH